MMLKFSSLHRYFEHFKVALTYGKENNTTLEEIQSSIRTKRLTKMEEVKVDDRDEGMFVSREWELSKERSL